MPARLESLPTFDDVCRFVIETLSNLEMLKCDQFQLAHQLLYRKGRPCGVHFCLHGPRALLLSAVWDAERNAIYFYGSCGRRVREIRLSQAPRLASIGNDA